MLLFSLLNPILMFQYLTRIGYISLLIFLDMLSNLFNISSHCILNLTLNVVLISIKENHLLDCNSFTFRLDLSSLRSKSSLHALIIVIFFFIDIVLSFTYIDTHESLSWCLSFFKCLVHNPI